MKKTTIVLFIALLLMEAAFAVAGDSVTIYKTGFSSVTSLSVCSPNDSYTEYVSAYGNDSSDLTIKAYYRNGVTDSYKSISETKISVDYGGSDTYTFYHSGEFVRIKLSGLGQGVGRLTAR